MPTKKLEHYYQEKVRQELNKCTECTKCLNVCPIYNKDFTIQQLNSATQQGKIEKNIKNFAWQCISCKRCISVCPEHLNRLNMMIELRSRLKAPYRFKRYLLIRGKCTSLRRLIQTLYKKLQQHKHENLAIYMKGTLIKKPNTDVLFYPGCYVHSPITLKYTLSLLDKHNINYSILGGMNTCCGLPHLLQGRYDKAETNLKQLHENITQTGCSTVISGCLECVEAIQLAQHLYQGSYCGQSIHKYLSDKNTPKKKKTLGNTLILRGCRASDTKTLETQLKAHSQHITTKKGCCAHWSFSYKGSNKRLIEELQQEITQNNIETIVCECLSCYEELKDKINTPTLELCQLLEETQ